MKKTLCIFACAIMLTASFAGCGGNEESSQSSATSQATTSQNGRAAGGFMDGADGVVTDDDGFIGNDDTENGESFGDSVMNGADSAVSDIADGLWM